MAVFNGKAVVLLFILLSIYLPGGTEDNGKTISKKHALVTEVWQRVSGNARRTL
jgi:hypothetical protein